MEYGQDDEDVQFETKICELGFKRIKQIIKKLGGISGRLDVLMYRVKSGFLARSERFSSIQKSIIFLYQQFFNQQLNKKQLKNTPEKQKQKHNSESESTKNDQDEIDFQIDEYLVSCKSEDLSISCENVRSYFNEITRCVCQEYRLSLITEKDEQWDTVWVSNLRLLAVCLICEVSAWEERKFQDFSLIESVVTCMMLDDVKGEINRLKSLKNDDKLSPIYTYAAHSFVAVFEVLRERLDQEKIPFDLNELFEQYKVLVVDSFQDFKCGWEDSKFLKSVWKLFFNQEDNGKDGFVDPIDLLKRYKQQFNEVDEDHSEGLWSSVISSDSEAETTDEGDCENQEGFQDDTDDNNNSDVSEKIADSEGGKKKTKSITQNQSKQDIGHAYINAVCKYEGIGKSSDFDDLADFIVCRDDEQHYLEQMFYQDNRVKSWSTDHK